MFLCKWRARKQISLHRDNKVVLYIVYIYISMRSKKPICAPSHLSEVSPTLPLKRFQCSCCWRWPCLVLSALFKEYRRAKRSFHASLLQAIDGVMPFALCPQAISQSPQHFRSFERQAACDTVAFPESLSAQPVPFIPACIYIYIHSCWWSSSGCRTLTQASLCSHSTFCNKLMESWGGWHV